MKAEKLFVCFFLCGGNTVTKFEGVLSERFGSSVLFLTNQRCSPTLMPSWLSLSLALSHALLLPVSLLRASERAQQHAGSGGGGGRLRSGPALTRRRGSRQQQQ